MNEIIEVFTEKNEKLKPSKIAGFKGRWKISMSKLQNFCKRLHMQNSNILVIF